MNCQGWHVCAIKPANTFNKVFKRLCTWLGHVKVLSQKTARQKHCQQMEDCFLWWQTNSMSPGHLRDLSPSSSQRTHQAQLGLPQELPMCYSCFLECFYTPSPIAPGILPICHHQAVTCLLLGFTQISAPIWLIQKALTWPANLKQYYYPPHPQYLLMLLYFIFSSFFATWHDIPWLFVCSPH